MATPTPTHKVAKHRLAKSCQFLYTCKNKHLVFDIYQDVDDHDFPYVAVYEDPYDGKIEEMAGETPKAAMGLVHMILTDTADECPPDDIVDI